jgi:hypothetical protein
MVSNSLPQPAQSLLNAGFDVGRTVGAVLEYTSWLGRWLHQPLPGLVADWAGLVALGAVEAIVPVWIWGVGHGDQSWVAVRADQASAEVAVGNSMRWRGQPHALPDAEASRPARDVTLR